jgi:hypothetical protein
LKFGLCGLKIGSEMNKEEFKGYFDHSMSWILYKCN